MTATTNETRTAEIAEALNAISNESEISMDDLPEVLQNSAIAGVEAVQNAIHAIGYHLTLDQVARFFATIYTEQDRDAFLAAYEAAAPACYDQEADLETSAPWCCPWLTGASGAAEGSTPASLGRDAALAVYEELDTLFSHEHPTLSERVRRDVSRCLVEGGDATPAYLEPDRTTIARAYYGISEARERLPEEEAGRVINDITRDCISACITSVAMREAR